VCRPSLTRGCERLATCRRLARCQGWIHIPFRGQQRGRDKAADPGITCAATPHSALCPTTPTPFVSARTCSRINLVPVPAISPGGGQGPRSGAGHCGEATSTILPMGVPGGSSKRSSEGNFGRGLQWASTPVDRADRGNHPISRRVDTISKQYQDSDEGGGAPWES
jgi:hypothetical protein